MNDDSVYFESDLQFMKEAMKEASKALAVDEVPVGAVLVLDGRIVARSHNQVETLCDATAHAEMLCLSAAFEDRGNWRLKGTTLYVTPEPCCMCAGALFLARVDRVVWGAPDLRVGAGGSWVNVLGASHPIHRIKVSHGILQEEAADLMRQFFRKQRHREK
jgi:tRNA(adenine34) deaminase